MKTSELIKILKENGWQFCRHGGNHDLYVHKDFPHKIPVQRTKSEVPTGTAKKILKDAGVK